MLCVQLLGLQQYPRQATELLFVQRTVSHTEERERISYSDITS